MDDRMMQFIERWVAEWEATWVDPDDQSHEWAELYAEAKQIIRDASGGHVA